MKLLYSSALFSILFFLSISIWAQQQPQKIKAKVDVTDDGSYKNSIRMNIFNAMFSYPSFTYERFINPHLSLCLDASFRATTASAASSSIFEDSINRRSISSFILHPALRLYIFQNPKSGLNTYASFFYKYRYFQSENDYPDKASFDINGNVTHTNYDNTYTETTHGAGMLIGFTTSGKSRIVADFFLGTQFLNTSNRFSFIDKSVTYDRFKRNIGTKTVIDPFSVLTLSNFRCGFTIGVKF